MADEDDISSLELAQCIVAALVERGLVATESAAFAIEIAEEEIQVRKDLTDFYSHELDHDTLAGLIVDGLQYPEIVSKVGAVEAVTVTKLILEKWRFFRDV